MLNRRETLLGAGVLAAAPALALAQTPSTTADAALDLLFDQFMQEGFQQRPEAATQLGVDKGAMAPLKSRLSDVSAAGRAANRALTQDQLRLLRAVDRSALSPSGQVNYDTILYTRESAAAIQAFPFGGASYGPSPYVVSQLTGAYQAVPDFLDTKHKIETQVDADAYLARLEAFAVELDQNTEQMRHDSGLGVVPPDFILDTSLAQMTSGRKPADQATVVVSIARRAAAKGLGDRYGQDAARLYQERIGPALDRQIALTRTLRQSASHDAGCWKFNDGEAFYRVALHATTTTRMTPDEVHQLGLDQAKAIQARLEPLLAAQGLTKGTIGERIHALYDDKSQFFANTDAGKAELIAYCNQKLDAIRLRLPRDFKRLPPYKFEVRAVPAAIDAGAPLAYSEGPAIDGSRPGLVYFNLHDTAEWPRWNLPTTVFHEGLPGHQLEGGLALSDKSLPLIRKTTGFSGYAEGWALYAEQLADELGMYEDDPRGKIGYLKAQLFRCGRCVVDTGIHHMRWSREQAIGYLIGLDGDAAGSTTREVDRYCSIPSQACSYKIGHTVWITARAKAKAALGPRYDIKDFHEAGLSCGRVPLEVLQSVIDRYIAARSAA
jgi:uncharacterized protein (DUF885 family)